MQFSAQPYPGLRPFLDSETDIFFGRDRQIDRLLARLEATRFVAVLGASGCGKSSLVRAGLIPALETGFLVTAGARWDVVVMRPGTSPIVRLAQSLVSSPVLAVGHEDDPSPELSIAASLRRGPRSLVEVLREAGAHRPRNVCIIVDQFEELFRFTSEEALDESQAFIDLLIHASRQREVDVYVVVTMRSDYLGESSQLKGLPEVINEGLYLTPHLTRDEAAEAIKGPVKVCGGDIDARLVNRLLNDFGPGPDNLPLLQHVLMRMWNRHPTNGKGNGAAAAKRVLSSDDYETAGGMSDALSRHADSVLDELSEHQRHVAKVMFQRLTLIEGGRDRRTPASVRRIAKLADADVADVIAVANAFRQQGRSFIMPPATEPIASDTTLDISHESLIRRWGTLQGWANEEARNVELLHQLASTAELWMRGEAALWRMPDLQRAQQWKDSARPTPDWAERYGRRERLDTILRFIEESSADELARHEELEQRRRSELRRTRLWACGFAALATLLGAGYWLYYDLYVREHSVLCNDVTRQRGIPQCVGSLSTEVAQQRAVSYRISRKGRYGRVIRMDAIGSDLRPTAMHWMNTYTAASSGKYDPYRETTWLYEYDAYSDGYPDGKVTREIAVNKWGTRVWVLEYQPSTVARQRTAYYVGPDGFPKVPEDGPEVFFDIEYDATGNEVAIRYRTRDGAPISARDDAFGQRRKYDQQGRMIEIVSLDAESKPMQDNCGNAILRIELDAMGNSTRDVALDAQNRRTQTVEGWSSRTGEFDAEGRVISTSYFDSEDRPISAKSGYQRVVYKRDRRGNEIEQKFYAQDGTPAPNMDGCFGYISKFDSEVAHFTTAFTCTDAKGQAQRDRNGVATTLFTPDEFGNNARESYLNAEGRPTFAKDGSAVLVRTYDANGNQRSEQHLGLDERPVMIAKGYSHREATYDASHRLLSLSYFDKAGKLTVLPENGYATLKNTYANGRLVRKSLFDDQGRPVVGKQGYAVIEYVRDALGRAVTTITFGPDGLVAASSDGYAVETAEYNAAGLKIRSVQRSSDWAPVADKSGVAEWRYTRNAVGKVTEATYFGADGKRTTNKDGVSGWRQSYNATGKVTELEYIDVDGQRAAGTNGIASVTYKYDSRGNQLAVEFRDAQHQLAVRLWDPERPDSGGRARTEFAYDRENHQIEARYFDARGNPMRQPQGWWRVEYRYDALGNQTEIRYYDERDQPATVRGYHREVRTYDRNGNAIVTEFFDRDGPTLNANKVARIEKEYDAYGHETKASYFDAIGRPTTSGDGTHRVTQDYDELGRAVLTRYFGTDGRSVNSADGYSEKRKTYDVTGQIAEWVVLGADSQPATDKQNEASRVLVAHDVFGRVTSVRKFEHNGALKAEHTYRYTRFGETAREIMYDAKHQVVLDRALEYDDRRRVSRETQDSPLRPFFASVEYIYGRNGALAWKVYWQRNGERAVLKENGRECLAHRYSYSRETGMKQECYTHAPTPAELAAD